MAQGYSQQEGIDYTKTFAPVARLESIILLILFVVNNGITLYRMDVKSDFLNGYIDEEVYVHQPLALKIQNIQNLLINLKNHYMV